MRTGKFGLATAAVLALGAAAPAHAFGPDDYIGSVGLFAGTFCPAGTLEAAGQELSISEYETLFTLYGTTYGGDGQATFALPDLRKTVPVPVVLDGAEEGWGLRYCVMLYGPYPSPS